MTLKTTDEDMLTGGSSTGANGAPQSPISDGLTKFDDDSDAGDLFGEELKKAMKRAWAEKEQIDTEFENNALKAKVRNLHDKLAEVLAENFELKTEVNGLQENVEVNGLQENVEVNGLQENVESRAATDAETLEMQKQYDQLVADIQDKKLELAMHQLSLKSAEKLKREEISRLRSEKHAIETLTVEHEELKSQYVALQKQHAEQALDIVELMKKCEQLESVNGKSKTSKDQFADLNFQVNAMMTNLNLLLTEKGQGGKEIEALKAELRALQSKNQSLTADIVELKVTNTILTTNTEFAKSQNARLEVEKRSLQAELTPLKNVRLQLLAERHRTQAATFRESSNYHTLQSEKDTLQSEKDALQQENASLKTKIKNIKVDIAFYITHLDLAEAGFRVFTCFHDRLSDIPDGKNCTREKFVGLIATHFFRDYNEDDEFLSEYTAARQNVLQHHRAHERAGQGRGDHSSHLKDEFMRVDANYRNNYIHYH